MLPADSPQLSALSRNFPWPKKATDQKVVPLPGCSLQPMINWHWTVKVQSPHINLGQFWMAIPASELHIGSAEAPMSLQSPDFAFCSIQPPLPFCRWMVITNALPFNFLCVKLHGRVFPGEHNRQQLATQLWNTKICKLISLLLKTVWVLWVPYFKTV